MPAVIFIAKSFTPSQSTKIHIMRISAAPLASRAVTNAASSRKTVFASRDFEPKTQSLLVKNANKTATIHAITVAGTTGVPASRVAET